MPGHVHVASRLALMRFCVLVPLSRTRPNPALVDSGVPGVPYQNIT
jgi:hypothetical protein